MNNIFGNKKQFGFTLIELLVATAIMGVLAVMSSQIIVSILRSQNKTAVINNVRQNGDYALTLLERDVKAAEGAGWPSSSTAPFGQALQLRSGDSIITWVCFRSVGANAGYIARQVDSDPLIPVTSNDTDTGTNINDCRNAFILFPTPPPIDSFFDGGVPWRVEVSFTLESAMDLPNIQEFKAKQKFEAIFVSR